eukprot:6190695-Pleurochrysis_carterae.AAC.2
MCALGVVQASRALRLQSGLNGGRPITASDSAACCALKSCAYALLEELVPFHFKATALLVQQFLSFLRASMLLPGWASAGRFLVVQLNSASLRVRCKILFAQLVPHPDEHALRLVLLLTLSHV